MRVDESGGPGGQIDVVTEQLGAHHLDLPAHHVLGAGHEVADRDLGLDPVAGAVELTLAKPVRYSTASRRVLDGIVPVFTQTPPIIPRRSTTHTRLPSFAAAMAAFCPPGPDPITSRSKSYIGAPSIGPCH